MNSSKKNKSIDSFDDYLNSICTMKDKDNKSKSDLNIGLKIRKNKTKIENENMVIPTFQNPEQIIESNYNVQQLKIIAKHYKLHVKGNKPELVKRIHNYLYFSNFVIKIQRVFRGMIQRKYNFLHGPAYKMKNRHLCTNQTDFISLENLNDLDMEHFFSYKDSDGFIYGFELLSIYNLIYKGEKGNIKNPYNRNNFPESVFTSVSSIIKLSKLLKIKLDLSYDDDTTQLSNEKSVELRCNALFQNIDSLGNYSDASWFLSLNRYQLIKFVRELLDIWDYRAQLTQETKMNICPPHGNPFRGMNFHYINHEPVLINVKRHIIEIMEKMINGGIDRDSKSLGAYYVLGALTIVNTNAANALPWLYQSLCYY
jgi:hypothetical protein